MSTSFKIEDLQLAQAVNVYMYIYGNLRHSEIDYTAVSKAA